MAGWSELEGGFAAKELSKDHYLNERQELIEFMADGQSQLSAKDVELAVKLLIDQMAETLS